MVCHLRNLNNGRATRQEGFEQGSYTINPKKIPGLFPNFQGLILDFPGPKSQIACEFSYRFPGLSRTCIRIPGPQNNSLKFKDFQVQLSRTCTNPANFPKKTEILITLKFSDTGTTKKPFVYDSNYREPIFPDILTFVSFQLDPKQFCEVTRLDCTHCSGQQPEGPVQSSLVSSQRCLASLGR